MAKSKFRYLPQFWTEERNLTWLLVALILNTFILDLLVSVLNRGFVVEVIINSLAFSVILLLGLITLTGHKVIQIFFVGITVLIISVRSARLIFGEKWLLVLDILLSMMSLITFVIVLLINVFQKSPVTEHRIRGAVAAYLLIAMIFALGDLLIDFLIPGAFHFPDNVTMVGDIQLVRTFYYYSISTLATLGFGDITPVHPFAQKLAMMEALIGQLYPATLIARLVTLQHATGRTDKDN